MKKFLPAIFMVCLSLAIFLTTPVHSATYILSLQNEKGAEIYARPVGDGCGFAIQYIHSVALTPVTDYFVIKNGKIYLDRTIYHDFGAGLPHAPEQGQHMRAEHGEISITGFNRELPDFGVRVGRVADHRLLIFGDTPECRGGAAAEEVPLAGLSPPGSVVMFRTRKQ